MTDPVKRYDAVFLEALSPVASLLSEPAVAQRWEGESALARMSVGSLACHLNRQLVLASQLLGKDSDFPVLTGADEHYARAVWVTTLSPDDPENDRSDSDAEAALGYAKLLETNAAADRAVRSMLGEGTARDVAGLPWQGWALTRDAFLLTRMLELVVHSDDLAISIGVPTPEFPEAVFTPVIELITRLALRRNGQSALISTLSRRERPRIVSAF